MSEKVFENKIIKWLHEQGIYKAGTPKQDKDKPTKGWMYKMWGGGMGAVGIPDLICCVNGKFVAIEVKVAKGVASKLQEINVQCINDSNGIGLIVYPKDFDTLKEIIGGLL